MPYRSLVQGDLGGSFAAFDSWATGPAAQSMQYGADGDGSESVWSYGYLLQGADTAQINAFAELEWTQQPAED